MEFGCHPLDAPGETIQESGVWIVSSEGEALAKFLGKARFGYYEFNGRGPMLWEAFVLSKNGPKVFQNL